MDIILVCDKRAYVTYKVKGHCCGGTGWESGNCQIHRRILCDTHLCAEGKRRMLEKLLGHPIAWRFIGKVPIEGLHMYVVDHLGEAFEVAKGEDKNSVCQEECSAYTGRLCKEYCSGRAHESLRHILGDAIGIAGPVFRRVE